MSDLGQDGVSASVRIFLNGIEYGSGLGSFGWQGSWIGGSCGTKDLQICLRVEPGAPRWALLVDNVASVSFCDAVAIERSLWGTFKSLYRD
jgi:hypothetical protein